LFSLKVKAENLTAIKETLRLNSKITPPEAYDENLEIYDLNLVFEPESGREVTDDFVLYQNRPNPFETTCKIGFVLPKPTTASLTIFDFSGKVVTNITKQFQKGFHEMELTKEELGVTGVLYYRLETEQDADTKKMVLLH